MPEINPYASPLFLNDPRRPFPVLPEDRWNEIDVRVVLFTRGWWRRWLTLVGSIDAEVEYDPRGNGERVYVNGQIVASTSCWGWDLVVPHIDFVLTSSEYLVPA